MQTVQIHRGNSAAQLVGAPAGLIELLRYDLAYQDPEAVPTPDWDGWYRLVTREGLFPAGLVPHTCRLLTKYRVPFVIRDQRQRPEDELPLFTIEHVKKPRDYQLEFARRANQLGTGVIDSAPRSGKTLTCALAFDLNPLPTLWIAPTKGIVRQTVDVLKELLPGVSVIMLTGDGSALTKVRNKRAAYEAKIVVSTAATAVKLPRDFYRTRHRLVIDEFHHAAASTYQEINRLAEDVFYRLGATGTWFRSDENTEILMDAVLSDVIGRMDVSTLIRAGHLVPADVLFVPIEGPRVYSYATDEAYRFAVTFHDTRNAWVAWAARALVAAGRRTIVLVKYIAHGEKLMQLMPEATFVNGEDSDAVEAGIAAFNAGKIPILIGTSVLGEGRDLPAADALVYAKAGRARVTVTQDFFRVLTAAHGKTRGIVVDFADRHSEPMLRHAVQRAKLYAGIPEFGVELLTQDAIQNFHRRVASSPAL